MKFSIKTYFHSLNFRLIASIVLVQAVTLWALVWIAIQTVQNSHSESYRESTSNMIRYIAAAVAPHMAGGDLQALSDFISTSGEHLEFYYLTIEDTDQRNVASLGAVPQTPNALDDDPLTVNDGVFDIAYPVTQSEIPLGEVRMGFSDSSLYETTSRTLAFGIGIGAIGITLTIIITLLIGRGITSRLGRLSKAATQVGIGDYSVNLERDTNDEIGSATSAFNQMISEIVNRSEQLEIEENSVRRLLSENRQLISASIEAHERERKQLSDTLHEELIQCLSAIQADAKLIKEASRRIHTPIETSANAIIEVAAAAYDLSYSLMQGLRPNLLDNPGLLDALNEEIAVWRSRNPETNCKLVHSEKLAVFGERENVFIFRVVQECLTNIAKHAEANAVTIQLDNDRDHIYLKIKDNGQGVDAESPEGLYGLGLIGMRERVEALGGVLSIETASNKGFFVDITLPRISYSTYEH